MEIGRFRLLIFEPTAFGARDSAFRVFQMEERVIKQGWISLACVPWPPSALLASGACLSATVPLALPLAEPHGGLLRARGHGCWRRLQPCPPVASMPLSSLPAPAPNACSFSLRWWKFCHGVSGFSEFTAGCTLSPPALWWSWRKGSDSVVRRFFHLLSSPRVDRFPPSIAGQGGSFAGRADIRRRLSPLPAWCGFSWLLRPWAY